MPARVAEVACQRLNVAARLQVLEALAQQFGFSRRVRRGRRRPQADS